MLNVYNKDYERIGYIESYSYLSWTRRYFSSGEFVLKCAPENLPLLSLGNVIAKVNDAEGGIIETILVETVEKEIVTVQGRFLPALLGKRILWEREVLDGDIGLCIGQLVNNHAINPADPKRKIPHLHYQEISVGENVQKQISFQNLLMAVTDLCRLEAVGFKGILKDGVVLLSLYLGKEQPFVFSREFENLLSQNYADSLLNFANVAKIGGEGEGLARRIITTGDSAGLERSEIFVDARDLSSSEYETEEDYFKALVERGNESLFERRRRVSFDAVANTNSNLIYREDFDLGDVVTVKSNLLGFSQRLRITEVIETYDENGLHVDLVFGDPLPTLGGASEGSDLMERSAFFNSVAGDRKYKAEIFAGYFSKFITNGVFPLPADNLRIAAHDRMKIKADIGTGYINGYLYENTDILILTVPTAHGVKARVDRVVLRWSQIERNIRIYVKEGIPDAAPCPPNLERTADIYELGLANVYVDQGAYEIKEADITDTRLDTECCGIVNSLLQADTTAIFHQYLDWFNTRTNEYDAGLNSFLAEYEEAKAEWLNDMNSWFLSTTTAFEEGLFDKQEEYKALAEGYLAEIESLIGDVEAGELLNRVRWLQENLGFIPIDAGDFFEDYVDFSPDGGKF